MTTKTHPSDDPRNGPELRLRHGHSIPHLGLGTWPLVGGKSARRPSATPFKAATGSSTPRSSTAMKTRWDAVSALPALRVKSCSSPASSTRSPTASTVCRGPTTAVSKPWAWTTWTCSCATGPCRPWTSTPRHGEASSSSWTKAVSKRSVSPISSRTIWRRSLPRPAWFLT